MIFKRKIQNLKEKQIQISAEENFLNLKFFSSRVLVLMTSVLVIFVAVRMGYGIFI